MFQVLLFLGVAVAVQSTCYSYLQGANYTAQGLSNSSYCSSVIRWPISDAVINNSLASDTTATSLYARLYALYKGGGDPSLNIDCLGIAMYAFCAYSYPTCTPPDQYGTPSNDTSDRPVVCKWLCDLWQVRCPTMFEFYQTICSNQASDTCSAGYRHLIAGLLLLLMVGFA